MRIITAGFRRVVFAFLSLLLTEFALFAQPGAASDPQTNMPVLRVLARNIEPFCFEKDGQRTGFAVDLWKEILRIAGFRFEVQDAESAQAVVDGLAAKKGDIGLGALTSPRNESM